MVVLGDHKSTSYVVLLLIYCIYYTTGVITVWGGELQVLKMFYQQTSLILSHASSFP